MQKNDFEKQVQQQLQDFSLLPGEAVWQKVEARIEEDKKRRRILFLWLFAGILLLGGGTGFLLMSNTDDNKITSVPKITSMPEKGTNTSSKNNEQNEENTQPEDENIIKKESPGTISKKEGELKKRSQIKKQKTIASQSNPTSSEVVNRVSINQPEKPQAILSGEKKNGTQKTDEPVAVQETITSNKELTNHVEHSSVNNIITDEKPVSKIESKPTAPPVEENITTNKKPVKQNKRALVFGAMVLGGVSNNVSSIPIFSEEKANDRLQNFSSVQQGQSSSADMFGGSQYNYSSSYSWGAGVFAVKPIGKKWSLSVGLNYQLMSSKIAVGARIDSSRTFQDSSLRMSSSVSSFYRTGGINEYRNTYHLLQFPVDMVFQINKNAEKPITISAGFTGGVLVGSSALYYNRRARFYYKEEDHFKKLMLSTQAALSFTVANRQKYQIQAGPHVQYQLSNLTKPVINTNEHLWFYGLKGNILFKKNK